MMLVFLLIASLAIWSGEVSAQKKAPTSLSLLTDDFLTLSRIVNAIYLRTSQVQKTMKARDVVSELLEINPSDLTEMLSTDIDSALVKFEIWRTNRNYTDASFDKDAMRDSIDWLKLMLSWDIGFDEYLEMPLVIDSIGAIRQKFDLILNDCSIDKDFYDIADSYHMDRDEVGRIAPEKDLEPFENNLKQFLKCYRDILILKKSIDQKKEMLEKYFMLRAIPELMEVLGKIKDTVNNMRKDVDASRPLWKDQTSSEPNKQIAKLYAIEKRRIITTLPLPILTVGFHTPQDLLKVSEDLERKFFEKQFVRGAKMRFQKLLEFMEPFDQVANEIQELHAAWLQFDKILDAGGDRSNFLKLVPDLITTTENSFDNGQNYSEYAKSVDDILKECVGKPTKEYLELSEQVKKQDIEITKFAMKDFPNLRKNVERVVGGSVLVDGMEMLICQHCLEDTLRYFQDKNGNDDKWEVLHNSLKHFNYCNKQYNVTKRNFTGLLEDFRRFLGHVTEMNAVTMEKTSTLSDDTWSKLMQSSNIDFATNCLRKNNIQLDALPEVMEFVGRIKQLTTAMNLTLTHLDWLKKAKQMVEKVETLMKSQSNPHRLAADETILVLNDMKEYAEILGICSRVLNDLTIAQSKRIRLLAVEPFSEEVQQHMLTVAGLKEYLDPVDAIEQLVDETVDIEKMAQELRKKDDVVVLAEIFEPISRLKGIEGEPSAFRDVIGNCSDDEKAVKHMELLMSIQLNFVKYRSNLKEGRNTVAHIKTLFDKAFGHYIEIVTENVVATRKDFTGMILSVTVFGFFSVCLFIVCCCSRSQRDVFIDLWIFHYGSQKHYEERWRYSFFADKIEGKNVLLSAVQERNMKQLVTVLNNGAFINAYNNTGNTALHIAVSECYPEIIEVLIKKGADRNLLNTQNKTAEQLIPVNFKVTNPDKAEQFEQIQAIFDKYKDQTFRMRVPAKMSNESFHFWVDSKTLQRTARLFKRKFDKNSSDAGNGQFTHVIVETNSSGVLITDEVDMLYWIFNGAIIVEESWMSKCLEKSQLINRDFEFLVKEVNYYFQTYNTIQQWSMAKAKSEIPYLHGVYLGSFMDPYPNYERIISIVRENGGVILEELPEKKQLNVSARPYLHSHLGPIFLLHCGWGDMSEYRNDPDNLYTCFTETQFIDFMLRRDIRIDTRPNPLPLFK